jgi:hypothetical protein
MVVLSLVAVLASASTDKNGNVATILSLLQFNTSGSWADGDPHGAVAAHLSASPFNIGQKAEGTLGGTIFAICPYEYQYTNAPASSGVLSTDMKILEDDATIHDEYFLVTVVNGVQHTTPKYTPNPQPTSSGGTYQSGAHNVSYVPTPDAPPVNPTMYAVDVPGPSEADRQGIMSDQGCNLFQESMTLTSHPLYHGVTNPDDTKTHIFTYKCTATITGGVTNYNWTVSP